MNILAAALYLWIWPQLSTCQSISSSVSERFQTAIKLLENAPLIDTHNDLPLNMFTLTRNQLASVNLTQDLTKIEPWASDIHSHTDIPRLIKGRLGAQFWAVYINCHRENEPDPVGAALRQIDVIKRMIDEYSDYNEFAQSSTEIEEMFKRGQFASLIGLEGGNMINSSLATLRMMYNLGVRYMTLTHSCNTPWAASCTSESKDSPVKDFGLTTFGKKIVKEMNRLGMMVDLSHVSIRTMRDAIQTTSAPVIFSHSAARAKCDDPRNVPDEILRQLRQNNGVVMLTFYSKHIECVGNATIDHVVGQINHIRDVAGVDHIGIGADYDGVPSVPKGLEDVSKYPYLFAELLKDPTWTIENLKKLAGGNILRVFRRAEEVRDSLREMKPIEDFIPEEDLAKFFSTEKVPPLCSEGTVHNLQLLLHLGSMILVLFNMRWIAGLI